LLATLIGTGAWAVGLARDIWPAHPLWAAFFLTLGASVILMRVVPEKATGMEE
jgi:hypothetical protein